ncbi:MULTISPECIES: spore gernimation protein GerPD [unclassified Paenibacillus]|uniref:spore gernimation protein GerPD n=1 Tax=unclassified Paenibacillus TaxID=185978 RepID=UPI001AE4DC17|nr:MULTISPECIES: spore gernimation protein GerPD [unclassified Paenibacillus]MBP1156199.1 spore germination protein PD [Paenibacillus sp. PvP091]MBP1168415.1 spore germination protein PD [Paenibacillus sp. PvR098]MBP2439443.1 spore germination protein PD [Paenibacillus sp. PvP052]
MILKVENNALNVGSVKVTAVASSSILLIGDTQVITLSSVFDTPPESLIIGPLEPLSPEE